MVESFKNFWKNAFMINGRMSRSDFWWAYLANILFAMVIGFVLGFMDGILGKIFITNIILLVYYVAFFVGSLTAEIRRLHDTNRSGWFVLISLIPLIGSIILLVFLCSPTVEPNQYGKQL